MSIVFTNQENIDIQNLFDNYTNQQYNMQRNTLVYSLRFDHPNWVSVAVWYTPTSGSDRYFQKNDLLIDGLVNYDKLALEFNKLDAQALSKFQFEQQNKHS